MSQALYRKYRPKSWEEVVGQDHVVLTLRNAVTANRLGHAYLFAGPRGTGKTTLARILAKAINCLTQNRSDRPCNACENCRALNENRFLDLIEMDAASNTGVEDVRELRDKIGFAPSQGAFKVYIIDEVHMLSTSAFNALLKTLEEPPPSTNSCSPRSWRPAKSGGLAQVAIKPGAPRSLLIHHIIVFTSPPPLISSLVGT